MEKKEVGELDSMRLEENLRTEPEVSGAGLENAASN